MLYKSALVIGSGSFGTAIANVLAENFETIVLKVRTKNAYRDIEQGENRTYLPGFPLAANIVPALTWSEVEKISNKSIELIVSGLPTPAIEPFCLENKDFVGGYLGKGTPVVSLSKGIDPDTLKMPDDFFNEHWPKYGDLFTFLSGPSFAKELIQKQITLVTVGGYSRKTIKKVANMFNTKHFRTLGSFDVKGVLLGGALKNVIAIAGGIIEGLGHNNNTRAAMITRGIAEMLKFGRIYDACPETFYGLSGMGDLILTTTGGLSRNKCFGLELATGKKPNDIIASQRTVVEGYKTSQAVHRMAQQHGITTHIFDGVYQVLYNNVSPSHVIENLMKLPFRFEFKTED